jgi:hypothetical protein
MAGKFKADLVPKHYTVSATLDADGMFELIMTLRRFVDEFEAPEAAQLLLDALEQAFEGDLPQRIDVELLPALDLDAGDDEDDDDNGEEAMV